MLFIGEAPGYHEDRQGRPFIGPAGQFLNELLGSVGLDRNSVFITNVVKHRPPENRDPLPDEIAACSNYLTRQIAAINPKVIVTLGRFSMARFFPGAKISTIHGQAKKIDGRVVVAMFHPAAALHQQSLRQTVIDDFKRSIPPALAEARRLEAEGTISQHRRRKKTTRTASHRNSFRCSSTRLKIINHPSLSQGEGVPETGYFSTTLHEPFL